ncbi:MAG TPA: hypothetical protein VGE07_01310 [Herpetosiphonaceae bacterium]
MKRLSWLFLLLVLLLSSTHLTRLQAQIPPDERLFPETGYALRGEFLRYWEAHGGLAIFGYPISEVLWEDGRLVQYLERNRLELHPENPAPFRVLLGLLGEERLRSQGRDWRAAPPAPITTDRDCLYFRETRHSLCGEFRRYWEAHGGVAQFGFPITQPAPERSETDGKTYEVQYFERNRMELHPENPAPHRVLLGLLGSWRAGWLLGANRQPAAQRASVSGPAETVKPLTDLVLTVEVPGYDGPAVLRLYDAAGRHEHTAALNVRGGRAELSWRSGGALGAHPAAVLIGGKVAGVSGAVYRIDADTGVATGLPRYDTLVPRVREFLSHDISEYDYQGYRVKGYRSPDSVYLWLRDHVYQGLGYRYFETDMTSLLDYFRREQKPNGAFDDYFVILGDIPIKGRVEVEADLEFLFVLGVYQAWQATGDTAWMARQIEAMERGIAYSTSDPQRWDAASQLIKRPFTIDMWDFEYGGPTISPDGKEAPRHWIDENTKFGVMHGDNTGMVYAMQLLSRMHAALGDQAAAERWTARAAAMMERLNALAWNGTFFRHTVHLGPVAVPGVDEAAQLSLSNAYALNREALSNEQARSIISEYFRRRIANPDSLQSEWYSIDPPFPAGSFGTANGWGDTPGEYVNGGRMPLVGGELARGAFRFGEEAYAFDILRRYEQLITAQNGTYLWYYPAGNPGIPGADSLSTDGWGSSAMLAALLEGAAGLTDNGALYRDVTIAPRWSADPEVREATVSTRYGASLGYVAYRWQRGAKSLRLMTAGSGERATLRLLLPADAPAAVAVQANGAPVRHAISSIGGSRYVTIESDSLSTTIDISW